MRRLQWFLVAALCVAISGLTAVAADDKADPNGIWKWEQARGDQKREVTLKLKLADGKLTGSMPGRNNQETAIESGTFKDGEIAFTVTREFQGNKIVTKYKGKITGDTIKGKMESERDGQKREVDWEAKRVKEEKK